MQTAITRTSGPGRVLLVDDHPAVRRVLRSLLEEVGGWQVVGEADSGESAVDLVEQLVPDVVLMDCRMPGAGGVAATREIVQRWPEVAVVAHTAYADETYVRSWRTCASCTRPRSTAPGSWRPRTPASAPRWPAWRRST